MTDDARLTRLTELARSIWPMFRNLRVVATSHEAFVLFDSGEGRRVTTSTLVHIPHPRALDALEAALLVLVGDVSLADLTGPSPESLAEIPPLSPDALSLGRGVVGRWMARLLSDTRKVMPPDWRPTQAQVDAARRALTGEGPAWVEQLASEWERDATDQSERSDRSHAEQADLHAAYCAGKSAGRAQSAAELRARATLDLNI